MNAASRLIGSLVVAATLAGPLGVAPRPAWGTVLVALDTDTLIREAQVVALGRVAKVESAWTAPGRAGGRTAGPRIVTTVTLEAPEILKGKERTPGEVSFQVLGGAVGGIGQWVPGEPRFAVGEKVLVFLTGYPERPIILGMSLGKFAVEGGVGGLPERLVRPVAGGLELVGTDGNPVALPGPTTLDLPALRRQLAGGLP